MDRLSTISNEAEFQEWLAHVLQAEREKLPKIQERATWLETKAEKASAASKIPLSMHSNK